MKHLHPLCVRIRRGMTYFSVMHLQIVPRIRVVYRHFGMCISLSSQGLQFRFQWSMHESVLSIGPAKVGNPTHALSDCMIFSISGRIVSDSFPNPPFWSMRNDANPESTTHTARFLRGQPSTPKRGQLKSDLLHSLYTKLVIAPHARQIFPHKLLCKSSRNTQKTHVL